MSEWILSHVNALFVWLFIGSMFLIALWESFRPVQVLHESLLKRWTENIGLLLIGGLINKWVVPAAGIGWAMQVAEQNWGLFNAIDISPWLTAFACILLLELALYFEHVALHRVPWLWRMHKVHHTDLDYDLTTGLRFHPFEGLVSMGLRLAIVAALGTPVIIVVIHEAAITLNTFFIHANAGLPPAVDRFMRRLFVTPNMHRVHHSVEVSEGNSNYGNILSIWDRLFGTYIEAPKAGLDNMSMGLHGYRSGRRLHLLYLLWMPLEKTRSSTASDTPNVPEQK